MIKLWHTCNARWIWNDRDPGSGRNDTRPAPADSAMLTKVGQNETTLNRAECIKGLVYLNMGKDLSMKSVCINDHGSYGLEESVLATWIRIHVQAA